MWEASKTEPLIALEEGFWQRARGVCHLLVYQGKQGDINLDELVNTIRYSNTGNLLKLE